MTRYYQIPATFSEWRRVAGYSMDDCVMTFAVHRRTILNWESEKIEQPRAVFICLQLFSGRLDFLGKSWRGFRITTECIESPEGDFVRAWEIRALRYAMFAMDMRRDRRCQMNDDTPGSIDYSNISFIDKAPKKNQSKVKKIANSNEQIKKNAIDS